MKKRVAYYGGGCRIGEAYLQSLIHDGRRVLEASEFVGCGSPFGEPVEDLLVEEVPDEKGA